MFSFFFFNIGFLEPKLFRKQNPWILLSSKKKKKKSFCSKQIFPTKCLQYKSLSIIKIMGFFSSYIFKKENPWNFFKKKAFPNSFFFHDYPPFTKKIFSKQNIFAQKNKKPMNLFLEILFSFVFLKLVFLPQKNK